MISILLLFISSWLVLYLLQNTNLKILGIFPSVKRLTQFLFGLFSISIIYALIFAFEIHLKDLTWGIVNPINISLLFEAFAYHIQLVLTEELCFRGALLYVLVIRVGNHNACLISAFGFGIYHIFALNMLEQPMLVLLYIIVVNGFIGYAWAYSFIKSKSIFLPLGLHLGWNLTNMLITKTQPYGELLLSTTIPTNSFEEIEVLLSVIRGLFPPLIIILGVGYLFNKKRL